MGVGTGVDVTPPGRPSGSRLTGWTTSARALHGLAVASLVANVAIIVTGGAVRLTKSGLGCPTWPKCTGDSLTPTKAYSTHGIIEFTNRQLTFVLALVTLLTLVAAWRQRRERPLAALGFAGIPAQAVLGGITVLTDLNPYAVAGHFLLSIGVIWVYAVLVWRLEGREPVAVPPAALMLARVLALASITVLVLGTVVTGAGPHAGDVKAGRLHRIHLAASSASQLHADAVMVLIGLSVGLLALTYALDLPERLRSAAWALVAVELAQGVIGYVQYFTHLPTVIVGVHMLGSALVWLATIRVLLLVESGRGAGTAARTTA